jgi:hypothetical protein
MAVLLLTELGRMASNRTSLRCGAKNCDEGSQEGQEPGRIAKNAEPGMLAASQFPYLKEEPPCA